MLSRKYLLHARTGLWLERVLLEERKNQRDAKYHLQRQQQLQLRRQRQQDSAAHEASRAAAASAEAAAKSTASVYNAERLQDVVGQLAALAFGAGLY